MSDSARATVYFERALLRAAKIKAAASDDTFSKVVNDALRRALREDEEDLAAFEKRKGQSRRPFEDVLKSLRRAGRL